MLKAFFKRHLPRSFLNKSETEQLSQRVAVFEEKTGCELVFHFRRHLGKAATEFNRKLFYKFKLDQTTGHRGILITLSLVDRQFAIWADKGVAVHTGDKLWVSVCEGLARDLKHGHHLQALINAINTSEKLLEGLAPLDKDGHKKHFDNELSNAPLIEDEDDE